MSYKPHTPGPWNAIPSGEAGQERAWFIHQKDSARPIAKTAWYAMSKTESDSNARLITAAPELLAELSHVLACLDEDTCSCAVRSWYGEGHDTACPLSRVEKIENLISKIRGKQ